MSEKRKAQQRAYNARRRVDTFYILTHSNAPGVCKPGSSGWASWRKSTTQGAYPYGTVTLAYELCTPDFRKIESEVKKHFKDHRLNGDWVNVPVEEVISFVSNIPHLGVSANDNEAHRLAQAHVA